MSNRSAAAAHARDIVCIGASTGGLAALKQVLSLLPRELPAAVFVVQHQAELSGSHLAHILGQGCALSVADALHGERIERGRVYVAPADNHLLIREGHIAVVRSARENGHRPAVNPLFRTAAEVYGARVVAVVLTGGLDCGTAGLLSVKAKGGVSVAQDPDTAECRDMPANAIRSGLVDHVVPLEAMAAQLVTLTRERDESLMPASNASTPTKEASIVTCPHCHGSLVETRAGEVSEFECHVGHKFSLRSLYAEQADEVEFAMWAAIRALEESAALAKRMADRGSEQLRARFRDKERTMDLHASTLREMVLAGEQSTRQDLNEVARAPTGR
jgi:two-component system, chemotaxis family, protein-glutamate methylesterase/glutaminase